MTSVDAVAGLRERREAIVTRHILVENHHDVEATIETFRRPRYEVNGEPSDGADAVRQLLGDLMHGFPDLHAETLRLRHLDDAVLVEGTIGGTHQGEWAGIPPTGNRFEVQVLGIFEFEDGDLVCERAYLDMAAVLTQLGVLPAVG
ncbi:ester cyclase [Mycolicibacterium sp. S2-37]|uniref:ester cyclase n=1 Tax=Mycolicibacterium sp. S2-37 TaxID=2810297 RepID=UPI001A943602|nr:ester cyclase [Mycolicibacterium sp. S2-37]MBO0679977.1 ester cyclase [Mycolicibacterium sp. S2-37]